MKATVTTQQNYYNHFTTRYLGLPGLPSPPVEYLSCEACLEVKREDNQNCSVLCCVRQLCTTISTVRWAVLTVLWIGFCHTGSISLWVDLFVFVCMFFMFCFILHMLYWPVVRMVGWTWWDWSLVLRTHRPSVLWHCWLGHLTCKNPSPIWPIHCNVFLLPFCTFYMLTADRISETGSAIGSVGLPVRPLFLLYILVHIFELLSRNE